MYFEFRVMLFSNICSFGGYSRFDLFISPVAFGILFACLQWRVHCADHDLSNLTEELYTATWKHLIPAASHATPRVDWPLRLRIRVHALLA